MLGRGRTCWARRRCLARCVSSSSAGPSPSWLVGVPTGRRHVDHSLCRWWAMVPQVRALLVCAAEEPTWCMLLVGFKVSLCLWAPLRRHKYARQWDTPTLRLLWRVICCVCARCRKPELGGEPVSVGYECTEGGKSEAPLGACSGRIFDGGVA